MSKKRAYNFLEKNEVNLAVAKESKKAVFPKSLTPLLEALEKTAKDVVCFKDAQNITCILWDKDDLERIKEAYSDIAETEIEQGSGLTTVKNENLEG